MPGWSSAAAKATAAASPSDIRARVRRNLARVYPDLADVAFDHAWGGTLAVTASRLPYVAEVAPGVFSAGGYSGHGLALAGLCGKVCAEAVAGERGRFDLLRAPAGAGAAGRADVRRAAGAGGDGLGGGGGSDLAMLPSRQSDCSTAI